MFTKGRLVDRIGPGLLGLSVQSPGSVRDSAPQVPGSAASEPRLLTQISGLQKFLMLV